MSKPKIALWCNQLDNRGTGRALYDYATMLKLRGYPVVIVTKNSSIQDHPRYNQSRQFIDVVVVDSTRTADIKDVSCDIFYAIKSGEWDGVYHPTARNCFHGVFNYVETAGVSDCRIAYVSQWLASKHNSSSFVPHMIYRKAYEPSINHMSDLQKTRLKESDRLIVGIHGGPDSFDIPFVQDVVKTLAREQSDKFAFHFCGIRNFLTLKESMDPGISKSMFFWDYIPCDVMTYHNLFNSVGARHCMLHARERGETFGISCGEFAIMDRPILTYVKSPELAHLHQNSKSIIYAGMTDLTLTLNDFYDDRKNLLTYDWKAYTEFDSETVMDKFEEVFIK